MCAIGKYKKMRKLIGYKVFYIPEAGLYRSLYFGTSGLYKLGIRYQCTGNVTPYTELGFWAFKTRKAAYKFRHDLGRYDTRVCKVELTGNIAEHVTGYRSEFMRIVWEYK